MRHERFIVLLGLFAHAVVVVGKNDFNTAFPTTFAFNETTPFFWLDIRGTSLISLIVVGDSDQFERYELPLDPQKCFRLTAIDEVDSCTTYFNNGSASFGGEYAAKLDDGRLYHILLNYQYLDSNSNGSSESSVFRMINPMNLPTGSGVPMTTSISIVSQKPLSSQTVSISSGTGSVSRTPTSTISNTDQTISRASSQSSSSSPSPNQAPPSQPPILKNGLTPGAKVGITVGVLSLAIIVFSIILFLHRKRRVKKKSKKKGEELVHLTHRNTGIDLDDIAITLGSPVTYDRVSEGRRGWHQRDLPTPPVPRTPSRRSQSQQELLGSSF